MPDKAEMDGASAMIADAPFHPDVISSERTFRGHIWDVRREAFDFNGDEVVREFVDHTGAVAVLVIDDDDRVLLIQQYRHPVREREWEIPAGLLDIAEEDALVAAQRELAEEVDLAADEWNVLSDFHTTPGGSNEALRIYLARGLRTVKHDFVRTEEEADMVRRWVPLSDVVDAVLDRRVQNSILVIAALAAETLRARDWRGLAPADAPWPTRPTGARGA